MKVSPQALRLALLRIYAESGVEPGVPLFPKELGEHWARTGFRTSDLDTAMAELVQHGDATSGAAGGLALTDAGQASLTKLDDLELGSVADESVILEAHYRKKSRSAAKGGPGEPSDRRKKS